MAPAMVAGTVTASADRRRPGVSSGTTMRHTSPGCQRRRPGHDVEALGRGRSGLRRLCGRCPAVRGSRTKRHVGRGRPRPHSARCLHRAPSDSRAINGPNFFDALGARGRTYVDLLASRTVGDVPRPYQRGRGMGGSSAVNAMVALRGDPAMYASWGWDDVAAAWERVAVPCEIAADGELGPVDRALLASSAAIRVPLTRRDGRRVSSAEAYLWPVVDRPNLDVVVECAVDSVMIDRRRAVGVRLVDGSVDRGRSRRAGGRGDPLAGDPAPVRRRHPRRRGGAPGPSRRCRSRWCCTSR